MFLLVTLLNASTTIFSNGDAMLGLDISDSDDAHAAVRRRLIAPDNPKDEEIYSKGRRYLSFGGPLTHGRGLDEKQRSSEAYPYLLTSKDKVHNVAYPSYESTGPTMASLCTQSIVEGTNSKDSVSSIEYDVITLEYSFSSSDISKEAYLLSMELLIQRLQQRYPRAEIILVQIWTPSDLIHIDADSNRKESYEEWRRYQDQSIHLVPNQTDALNWIFRTLSQTEQEIEDQLEAMMASVGGIIVKFPLPETLQGIPIDDWFLEEAYNQDTETNTGDMSSFRYTLSPKGHNVLAKAIRDPRRNHRTEVSPTLRASRSSSQQLLYSWGSGDSCKLWYDNGKMGLPNPSDYSSGLAPSELEPGSYALEVTASKGGSLKVHNPFKSDKLVYLTYLTASGMATSNKVYPKTKVKMVAPQPSRTKEHHQLSSTSVLLNPSHGNTDQHKYHFTRTSAVGVLPALQTGTLEFSALEEYTIHPFRILGVSILHEDEKKTIPFEFAMFSPRMLTLDKKGAAGDEFDDDDETIDIEDGMQPQ